MENKRQGKSLLISWSVPPETTGSGIIVHNIASQFTKDEMVIAGERPYKKPNVNWGDKRPKIYYVQSVLFEKFRGIRWYRKIIFPISLMKLVYICLRERCRYVIAIYPNKEFLLLGYFTSVITGRKFVCYFHNTYLENQRGNFRKRIAAWVQEKCFKRAAHIYVMSEGMATLYFKNYPQYKHKISPLVHTFNEEVPEKINSRSIGSPIKFTFSGNVNESCKDAAIRLFKVITSNPNYRLSLLSNIKKAQLEQWGIETDNVSVNLVSREGLVDKLREADFLLLPHGFKGGLSEEEYLTIFPTKTIEYLISQRPIIAYLPENTFLHEFLSRHNCAKCIDDYDTNILESKLQDFVLDTDLQIKLVNNAIKTSNMFSAAVVANDLRKKLTDIDEAG